jgi:hypothetical protein
MYKLSAYFRGMPRAKRQLSDISRYLRTEAGKDVTIAGYNAAGEIFGENFQNEGGVEGNPRWAQLKERTQREREELGFDPKHPILSRYRDLRYITAGSLMNATGSGTFTATDPQGKSISVSLNVGGQGGEARATGEKSYNQGTRPYWFTTQPVKRAAKREASEVLANFIEDLL